MGLYAINNPGRAGDDVAKYNGWLMMNIIRDFVDNEDLTDMMTRLRLRRAMLVSSEYTRIAKGARVNV